MFIKDDRDIISDHESSNEKENLQLVGLSKESIAHPV